MLPARSFSGNAATRHPFYRPESWAIQELFEVSHRTDIDRLEAIRLTLSLCARHRYAPGVLIALADLADDVFGEGAE